MIGIYKITNTVNGKIYIGQGLDIEKRWTDHRNKETNVHLKRAMRKYGLDKFQFEVLYETTPDESLDENMMWLKLDVMEMGYIAAFKANKMRYPEEDNYNMTDGGGGSRGPRSEEAKRNISKGQTGKKRTEEHKKNLSKWQKGIPKGPMTEEAKINNSKAHKGLNTWSKGCKQSEDSIKKRVEKLKGQKRSDEIKNKMSEAQKGKKKGPRTEDTKAKISKTLTGVKHLILKCPYCNKEGGERMMKRWHFNNCKFK